MGFSRREYSYVGYVCLIILLFSFPLILGLFTQKPTSEHVILDNSNLSLLTKIAGHEAYLYFGYVGCSTQCPKALSTLNDSKNKIPTYFVNLIPGLEDQQVQDYVNFMGADNVTGIQASKKDLEKIEALFSNFRNGRIGVYNPKLHTDQVFLIKKSTPQSWILTQRINYSTSIKHI
jgi:hypothetical protein